MTLKGTVIKLASGKLAFDYRDPSYDKPVIFRRVWEIATWKNVGSYKTEADAIDKPAELREGVVNCYLGNGSAMVGYLKDGGKTESIINETIPVPPPKCRVEVEWRNGAWMKYLRSRGWVLA
jgi:hypothetical protein